jgi:predicted GNAT family acetyltransferase
MKLFGKKKSAPTLVTSGRFELERDGHIAYLEYTLAGDVLELVHTEVPEALRGRGMAAELAKTALDWARENHKKVDIVCPFAADYIANHPEYSDLILR